MSDVLNRTTRQYLQSVNEPDYPVADWIISPDVSAVNGFASKYWIITGDVVTLMSPAERAAVDAAEQDVSRDQISAELDQVESILRAMARGILTELNAHAAKINAILDAIDGASNLASLKTAVGAISNQPNRTVADLKAAIRNNLGT